MHTKDRLASALLELKDAKLQDIIKQARQGLYDDFLSPLVFPKTQLIKDLLAAGHIEFAQRVIDGEFDASQEEADAWASSPEGKSTLRKWGGNKIAFVNQGLNRRIGESNPQSPQLKQCCQHPQALLCYYPPSRVCPRHFQRRLSKLQVSRPQQKLRRQL